MTEDRITGEAVTGLDIVETQVRVERRNQDQKWGEQDHHPLYWLGIIMEELGEAAQASIEGDGRRYRRELVQVAASCVAAMESFDRRPEA